MRMSRKTSATLFLSLLLGLPVLARPAAACQSFITPNTTISGAWTSGCTSFHRAGRYARYYTFSLTATASVRIDLTSTADPYLYLLSGNGTNGAVLAQDDNGGGGLNARLTLNLAPGTYTVEATTSGIGRTGPFTLAVATGGGGAGGGGDCIASLAIGQSVDGSWESGCRSSHRNGSYARYYTFTVTTTTSVRIDLASLTDSYLYLLRGVGTNGTIVTQDDDSGDGFNARISAASLVPGTYTIEATTHALGRPGSFTLSLVAISGGGGAGCVSTIDLDQRVDGSWTSDCRSTHRSGTYARFYTFSISEETSLRADLTSTEDSYLYLLNGSGTGGAVLAEDEDGGDARGDSRIVRTLPAGTYTLEATTHGSGRTGAFTLFLTAVGNGGGGGGGAEFCFEAVALNTTTAGTWTRDCASAHRAGSAARFYTFSLRSAMTVQVDLAAGGDASLFLLRGDQPNGAVLAQNEDNDPRIRINLGPGTYTVEAAAAPGRTGSFSLTLGDAARMTVFLVHGLGQRGGALAPLANTLRHPQLGLDSKRFVLDSGFDWGRCADNPSCGGDCTVRDGGRALAQYINARDPRGQIVVIGYGLGGLLARDMMVNNYDGVVSRRKVAALVTLGSPNVGYPYCPEDETTRCGVLVRDMASQLRLPGHGRILQSPYLEDLNRRWASRSFPGRPGIWLAAAGTSCSAERSCKWEEDDAEVQGCPTSGTDANRSDGEVCAWSALFRLQTSNAPNRLWTDPNYAQTGIPNGPALCDGAGVANTLANPPAEGTLVREIRELLNRLRLKTGQAAR